MSRVLARGGIRKNHFPIDHALDLVDVAFSPIPFGNRSSIAIERLSDVLVAFKAHGTGFLGGSTPCTVGGVDASGILKNHFPIDHVLDLVDVAFNPIPFGNTSAIGTKCHCDVLVAIQTHGTGLLCSSEP